MAPTDQPLLFKQKSRGLTAQTAPHESLLDSEIAKSGVCPTSRPGEVNAATCITAPCTRIVLGKAIQLRLTLLRLRIALLSLKAKTRILSFQSRYAFAQDSEVLTEHRRRCMFVEQRLEFIEEHFNHQVSLRVFGKGGAA